MTAPASAPAPAAAAPAPKKRKTLLFVVALVVLLGGAGGGFWFWRKSSAGAPAHAAEPEKKEARGVLNLEPFLVNLADAEASRFLRTTVRLLIESESEAHHFEGDEVKKARLRSAILELLATQSARTLTTPEGKEALKKSIAERSAQVLKLEIADVLFTDFVVQF
jgi:flagellar FliL protein